MDCDSLYTAMEFYHRYAEITHWNSGGISKVHFVSSFSWNEKSPKSFAKLRAVKCKNGRQVFSDLSAVWSSYSVVREFKSIRKAKTAVLYLRICALKSRCLGSKKPRFYRGLCGTYLFYVPVMVEARGIEPLSENADAGPSPSAVSCFYSPLSGLKWQRPKSGSFIFTPYPQSFG